MFKQGKIDTVNFALTGNLQSEQDVVAVPGSGVIFSFSVAHTKRC